ADSSHKKKVCTLEPGPNPFRAPIILNVYIKYDERKQALDVLVRNLQNTPLNRKVRVNTKFLLPTCPQLMENKKLLKRFRSRERCSDGVVIVDARRTSKKRGPNPHFNEDFHFTPLIARDVKMGKLVFEIYEVKKKHKSFLGTIELCGSEIELKCDMAYSLYLHNPTCGSTVVAARERTKPECYERRVATYKRDETALYEPSTSSKSVSPSSSLPSLPSTIALLPSKAKTLPLNTSRNAIYEVIPTEISKSSKKRASQASDITVYEVIRVNPRKITRYRARLLEDATSSEPEKNVLQDGSSPKFRTAPDSSTNEVAIILRADIVYNERRQRMSVFIRNLEHVDEKMKHAVRCMLYTADGRRMGKQTKSKRGFNPYFNEEFKFRNLVRCGF
ncbi:hypothetical protein TSMEX_004207, partial [Taenia solium]